MTWKNNAELSKLKDIKKEIEKLAELEAKKAKESLERFIFVLEKKAEHELAKKTNSTSVT